MHRVKEGNRKDGSSCHQARSKPPERSLLEVGLSALICKGPIRVHRVLRFGKQEKVVKNDERED